MGWAGLDLGNARGYEQKQGFSNKSLSIESHRVPLCFIEQRSRMTTVVKRNQGLWLLADLVMSD